MAWFRDNDGNLFDIPADDLKRFKVSEVPAGAKLSGVQTEARLAAKRDSGVPIYLWPPIDELHQAAQRPAHNYMRH